MISRWPNKGSELHRPPGSTDDPGLRLYSQLRDRVGTADFDAWFAPTPCSFHDPNRFVLTTTNDFRKSWLERHYRDLVVSEAKRLVAVDPDVEFRVSDSQIDAKTRCGNSAAKVEGGRFSDTSVRAGELTAFSDRLSFKPDFTHTFEDFVVGDGARMPHAACRRVCSGCDKINPLILHGAHGSGKTHLLRATCLELSRSTDVRIACLTAEEFTNLYVEAARTGQIDAFRAALREIDVFGIDDFHFVYDKPKTQEQLLSTVSYLLDGGRQVILTTRIAPYDFDTLSERLVSRLQSGVIARLDSTDASTRAAILTAKAQSLRQALAPEIAQFIATKISSNLHEVSGVLATIQHVSGSSQKITLEAAALAVNSGLEASSLDYLTNNDITIEQVFSVIEPHFALNRTQLLSRTKIRSLVHARQVGMFLARELTSLSLEAIGAHFGGRDHTTVLYAVKRIRQQQAQDPKLRATLFSLGRMLSRS